jgi:TfoX/Sxy family transcriptional regulator of competence genes
MSAEADELADRIRAVIGHRPGVTEKKMFGGYGFMLNGNMVAGTTSKGALMVRVAPGEEAAALARPGAFAMTMGERTMKGFIGVTDDAIADEDGLREWIDYSERYVRTMPPKEAATRR